MSPGLKGQIHRTWRRIAYAVRFGGKQIKVHPSTWIGAGSMLRICDGGSIEIGRNCEIHPLAMIMTYGGNIIIGDHCSLNPFAIVYGQGGVRIGNDVRIASHVVIIPANHTNPGDGTPLRLAPVSALGITIGDNVWIGAGALILDGVEIGRDAIVGAGSVVTRSVNVGETVVGAPARPAGKSR